jgi:hypothetical protein
MAKVNKFKVGDIIGLDSGEVGPFIIIEHNLHSYLLLQIKDNHEMYQTKTLTDAACILFSDILRNHL